VWRKAGCGDGAELRGAPVLRCDGRGGPGGAQGLADLARRWRSMFPAEEAQRLTPLVTSLPNRCGVTRCAAM
jgi:hypothetical protein